jgi:hypothetical protein
MIRTANEHINTHTVVPKFEISIQKDLQNQFNWSGCETLSLNLEC